MLYRVLQRYTVNLLRTFLAVPDFSLPGRTHAISAVEALVIASSRSFSLDTNYVRPSPS
jgi:hypothetical protein